MSRPIIRVENLSKQYRLGEVGTGTLAHDLSRWWAGVRGKEDPFAKVGEVNDRATKSNSDYVWSLRDINFEVKEGEVLGIIGSNGAGKSTLLKILSKVTQPTEGRVKIKGRIASLLEVGTGFHPDLTGKENIFLNGAILGMTKREILNKFDEIVYFSGVERYIDTPVKRYSSGMYVRLAFAVAAHLEPEILIVDEVLAVGDAEFQKKCLGKMKDVSINDGRTVLFVSHQMGTIAQLCQNALVLKNGRKLNYGRANEMISQYVIDEKKEENEYILDPNKMTQKNSYFTYLATKNEGKVKGDFLFDESLVVSFSFVVENNDPTLQIGIALNNKFKARVFTVVKAISFFRKTGNTYTGNLRLPTSLIAPNSYSFTVALWTKNGQIYDLLDDICPIKIYDNGSELSLYEGVDYGDIVINPIWENG